VISKFQKQRLRNNKLVSAAKIIDLVIFDFDKQKKKIEASSLN
jgi:hypothetical protein